MLSCRMSSWGSLEHSILRSDIRGVPQNKAIHLQPNIPVVTPKSFAAFEKRTEMYHLQALRWIAKQFLATCSFEGLVHHPPRLRLDSQRSLRHQFPMFLYCFHYVRMIVNWVAKSLVQAVHWHVECLE